MSPSQDTNFRVSLTRQTTVVRDRQADTLIWWPKELLACFNNGVLGPINTKDVLRWIATLMGRPDVELHLRPVKIQPYNGPHRPIECRPVEDKSVQPLLDSYVLSPGDYCVYYQDTELDAELLPTRCMCTCAVPYPTLAGIVSEDKNISEKEIDPISNTLLDEAKQWPHSKGACVLTKLEGTDTITQWIFPPSQVHRVPMPHEELDGIKYNKRGFACAFNLITMRKDLYELFINNAFGVDVEDNFKIRVFHPRAMDVALPSRLSSGASLNQYTQFFLRRHFRWCLDVHFHGGGIEHDEALGRRAVEVFMDRLKPRDLGDNPSPYGDLTAADWESPLGRAISEFRKVHGLGSGTEGGV